MTAPAALYVQRTAPSDARSAKTVPFSVPKNSRPRSSSGEDSARLGSLRDHSVLPDFAVTATTRPPFEPRVRSRMTA